MKKNLLGLFLILVFLSMPVTNKIVNEPIEKIELLNPIVRLESRYGTFCTGSVVSDELIITAYHCIDTFLAYRQPVFITDENKTVLVQTSIVKINKSLDLAVLKGDFRLFDKLKLKKVQDGIFDSKKTYVNYGYAYGGQLLSYNFKPIGKYYFSVKGEGHVFHCMSGGPVIDIETNELVGVNYVGHQEGYVLVNPIVNLIY